MWNEIFEQVQSEVLSHFKAEDFKSKVKCLWLKGFSQLSDIFVQTFIYLDSGLVRLIRLIIKFHILISVLIWNYTF